MIICIFLDWLGKKSSNMKLWCKHVRVCERALQTPWIGVRRSRQGCLSTVESNKPHDRGSVTLTGNRVDSSVFQGKIHTNKYDISHWPHLPMPNCIINNLVQIEYIWLPLSCVTQALLLSKSVNVFYWQISPTRPPQLASSWFGSWRSLVKLIWLNFLFVDTHNFSLLWKFDMLPLHLSSSIPYNPDNTGLLSNWWGVRLEARQGPWLYQTRLGQGWQSALADKESLVVSNIWIYSSFLPEWKYCFKWFILYNYTSITRRELLSQQNMDSLQQ